MLKLLKKFVCKSGDTFVFLKLVTATWTQWQSQGCSVSCGEGLQKYTRVCVGAGQCLGDATKFEPCADLPACGKTDINKNPNFFLINFY